MEIKVKAVNLQTCRRLSVSLPVHHLAVTSGDGMGCCYACVQLYNLYTCSELIHVNSEWLWLCLLLCLLIA